MTELTVGNTFTLSESRKFTLDGVQRIHTYTLRYRVTDVTEDGIVAECVATVTEDNRPPFASTTTEVSIAAFAVPLYIANGRMVIDTATVTA